MRRAPWISRAALLVLMGASGCNAFRPASDVLLITLDTTRADHLGCYGFPGGATPNLDALAQESTLFVEAMASTSVTLPSHCTMMTALYPYRHGVRYNGVHHLPPEAATLAEQLAAAGFETGAVVSAFPLAGRFGLNQGFGSYEDLYGGPEGMKKPTGLERKAGEAIALGMTWWEKHRERKRFLWVHLMDPHWSYDPPFPFSVRYADEPYVGEIAYMDQEVGKLFEALRKQGDWDRTLVLVAGDHGEGLYEHGERWHSNLVYESTLRVPLLIKPPRQHKGRRVAQPVGLVDLTPTVLEYAGLPAWAAADGISLRRAVESGEAPLRTLYFEAMGGNLNYGWSPLLGVRRGPHKYFEGARPELYDLSSDPHESENLIGKERQRAGDLAKELGSFRDLVEKTSVAGPAVMDDETRAQLASLGYVGGSSSISLTGGSGIHPPDMVDLDQELLRAQGAISRGQWEEAIGSLDFVLAKDPANKFALHFRSKAHARVGEIAQALTLAQAMARIYPDSEEAQNLLGESLSLAGKPADSAAVYAGMLKRHPESDWMRYRRVLALIEARDVKEADIEVVRLEQTVPEDFTTHLGRAMVEAARDRPEEAISALSAAVDLGFHDFSAVEASPVFAKARQKPGYAALKARLKSRASS